MKRKKVLILSIVAIILLIGTFGGFKIFSDIKQSFEELSAVEVENVDLSSIADGTYSGSYDLFPVSAEVAVTISGHKITEIKLIRHSNGLGKAAEAIPDEVVKTGSLQVDTVSGATYSSKVILKAIENALKNAASS